LNINSNLNFNNDNNNNITLNSNQFIGYNEIEKSISKSKPNCSLLSTNSSASTPLLYNEYFIAKKKNLDNSFYSNSSVHTCAHSCNTNNCFNKDCLNYNNFNLTPNNFFSFQNQNQNLHYINNPNIYSSNHFNVNKNFDHNISNNNNILPNNININNKENVNTLNRNYFYYGNNSENEAQKIINNLIPINQHNHYYVCSKNSNNTKNNKNNFTVNKEFEKLNDEIYNLNQKYKRMILKIDKSNYNIPNVTDNLESYPKVVVQNKNLLCNQRSNDLIKENFKNNYDFYKNSCNINNNKNSDSNTNSNFNFDANNINNKSINKSNLKWN